MIKDILKEFYAENLPVWNALIETGLKKEIATWTSDPTENAERMEFYHPLLLVFQTSFSKETFETRPGILKALGSMDPEAYALDAAHKLGKGKPFDTILQQHLDGIAAWWEALNIHGYALESAKKEFVGSQTARIALKSKKVNLSKIENATRKKVAIPNRDPVEIASAVGLALAELLTKSAEKTPLSDNWEIPPGPLGEKIQEIFSHFDPATAQVQDAITGKHQIATQKAKDRLYDLIKKSREILIDPTEDILIEFDRCIFENRNGIKKLRNRPGDAQTPERIQIDIERVRSALTTRQQHILDIILTEPDASDVEISETLNIARNSVINCKKKLRSLLSSPTTK